MTFTLGFLGTEFLSNNVMLPILDFFYGIVPSYGIAIVALTLVIRFAVSPLSAGSIRNMRRMKVAQPAMQKRVKEIQDKYKDDPAKQQEQMSQVYKEFGNPLAGCLPVLLQMPILLALFATLRGSPFTDVNYSVNLQILPQEQIEQIQPQAFATKPQNIYVSEGTHFPVVAMVPGGNQLGVGQRANLEFQTAAGKPLDQLLSEYSQTQIAPHWQVTKGQERLKLTESGQIEALQPGDVTVQGTVPGIASQKGFLFIDQLGRVGAFDDNLVTTAPDGSTRFHLNAIHWDIVAMVLAFGISLYINQLLSGQGPSANPQQQTINKLTPVLFSGMFFFIPLPAGVLLYMLIANVFQTVQSFILAREPLPENLQKLVEAGETTAAPANREALPFEPGRPKKKTSA